MKSRLLAGVVAVLLAIVGAVLVVTYAQGADQRAVKDLDPVGVLVVTKAIPAGATVDTVKASVALEQVPGTAVAKSALNTLDESAGKVAAANLVPGEQLLEEKLIAPEDLQTSGSVKVPAGLQEVSFQLEPQRVVGGRLVAGRPCGRLHHHARRRHRVEARQRPPSFPSTRSWSPRSSAPPKEPPPTRHHRRAQDPNLIPATSTSLPVL